MVVRSMLGVSRLIREICLLSLSDFCYAAAVTFVGRSSKEDVGRYFCFLHRDWRFPVLGDVHAALSCSSATWLSQE